MPLREKIPLVQDTFTVCSDLSSNMQNTWGLSEKWGGGEVPYFGVPYNKDPTLEGILLGSP